MSQTEQTDPHERRRALLAQIRAAGWIPAPSAPGPLLLHEIEAVAATLRSCTPWTACPGFVIRRDGTRRPAWRNHYRGREQPSYLVEVSASHEPFQLAEATPGEIATFHEELPR